MADKDKSIIERAALDLKRIQEALNANTKEILRGVAKEEIDGIVKESLNEDLYEEEYVVAEAEEEEDENEEVAPEEEEETEFEDEESEEEEDENEEEDEEEMGSEEMTGDEFASDEFAAADDSDDSEEFELDMTDASDDDVIAVYKKLTGDDEIEVVYDAEDDELEINVNEPGDFIVKNVSAGAGVESSEEELNDFADDSEESDLDEMMYEIEMEEGEDLMEEEEELKEEEEEEDENMVKERQAGKGRTVANTLTDVTVGAGGKSNKVKAPNVTTESVSKKALTESENKYKALLAESKELKGRNEEYKTALKQFRTMLAETVVYNSNLTYVTKLFMEHSTTKEEKQTILKRFDEEVTTLKESQRLYKTIVNELSSKAPIKESVDKAITKEVATGTSKQLNESTAYIDKETSRIMDLMRRVENR